MDKFTKNALIACVALSAIIIVCFYAGTALGHSDLSGSDDKVTQTAAQAGNKTPHSSLYELDQNGEYVGFCTVGILGGLGVGYAWVTVFDEGSSKGGITRG
jgi:hypothetical protein